MPETKKKQRLLPEALTKSAEDDDANIFEPDAHTEAEAKKRLEAR